MLTDQQTPYHEITMTMPNLRENDKDSPSKRRKNEQGRIKVGDMSKCGMKLSCAGNSQTGRHVSLVRSMSVSMCNDILELNDYDFL